MLRKLIGKLIGNEPDFPMARIVDVGEQSVVFETTNSVEDYRARELGGERELVEEYVNLLTDETVVWDVGANIGVFSLFAARANAQVYAFEPDPGFEQRLERNIYLNGQQSSIVTHNLALNDTPGETTLFTDGVAGMSPGLSKNPQEEREEVIVDQHRGDELNIPTPDVLKVDVEGAEGGVIRGMDGILEEIETIMIELHPTMLPRFNDEPEKIQDSIESYGFSVSSKRDRNEQTHITYQQS
jgi:FkbM family methyltransferase